MSELVEGEVVEAVVAALERPPSRQRARLYELAVLGRNHGRLVGLLKVPLGAGLSLLSPRFVDTLEVLGLKPLGREESLGRDVGQWQQARTGLRLGALEVAELVVGMSDAHDPAVKADVAP